MVINQDGDYEMRHGQTELIMISIYIKACKKSSEITKIKKDSLYLRVESTARMGEKRQ